MNEEQNTPGKAEEAAGDTSKVFINDSSLQSEEEFENNKVNDDYYAVDNPKKELLTSIGDGEMRDEGTVGAGNIPEENPLFNQEPLDEQDKAEMRDSGN